MFITSDVGDEAELCRARRCVAQHWRDWDCATGGRRAVFFVFSTCLASPMGGSFLVATWARSTFVVVRDFLIKRLIVEQTVARSAEDGFSTFASV